MKNRFLRRYAGFSFAALLMAMGIALITNSNLGTTPITSLPFALGAIFSLSLGTMTFLLNAFFVLMQKVLLRKEFTARHLVQLPAVLLFSVLIDAGMWATQPLVSSVYGVQLAMSLAGCAVMGLGISLEIVCDATVLPGEGIVIAIAYRSHKVFSTIKILFDSSMVILAVSLSLLVLHTVVGLREGTVVAAVTTGLWVRFFSRWTSRLAPYFRGTEPSAKK